MKLKQKILLGILIFAGLFILNTNQVFAADTSKVTIKGNFNYDEANKVLEIVNEERTKEGLSKLTMDPTLIENAMLRAAENGVFYSHTRPNGTSCFTAITVPYNNVGENIAAGYITAEQVMEGWMSSEGHRANILTSNFKSIGIGCFKVSNITYWVQLFSSTEADTNKKIETGIKNRSQEVEVHKDNIAIHNSTLSQNFTNLVVGTNKRITKVIIQNKGWEYATAELQTNNIKFESSNTSILKVDNSGLLMPVNEGKANLYIKIGEVSKKFEITVTAKKLADCKITYGNLNLKYNGEEKKPSITIKDGNKTLTRGTDYTVVFKNNKNPGTATLTIVGKGAYIGKITKQYKITATGISTLTVEGIKNKIYTGKEITQTITIKNGSKTLKRGVDYTLVYKNNKDIGTATLTIVGKGGYSGKVTKTFKIGVKQVKGLKLTARTDKSIMINWTKDTAVTGYEIFMATSENGTYTKIATMQKNTAVTYRKVNLTPGKTYYFKVRAYKKVDGKNMYGAYSEIKQIKAK